MKRWLIGLLLAAMAIAVSAPAYAQGGGASSTGTIQGRVADAQGAVLPGVTVTAQNAGTNVSTTAISNSEGVYLLSSLVNGTYTVTFNLSGFAPSAREIQVNTRSCRGVSPVRRKRVRRRVRTCSTASIVPPAGRGLKGSSRGGPCR